MHSYIVNASLQVIPITQDKHPYAWVDEAISPEVILLVIELTVAASSGEQFFVRSSLDDFSLLDLYGYVIDHPAAFVDFDEVFGSKHHISQI